MVFKYQLKKLWLIFLVLFNTAFLFAEDKKKVLFISSYHPSFPTFFKQIDGVKSILKNVQVDVEFMDSKRFDYDEADEMFSKKLKWKFKSLPKYDAVITSDDNALIFLLKYKKLFFPNTPAVFLGVNNLDIAIQQNENPSITGVVEAVSMFDTVRLMEKLHPNTDKIIAISDRTSSGMGDLNKFKKLSKKFPNKKLEYISVEDYKFDSFWEKLAQLDKNTPVLLLSAYSDKDGNRMNFNDSLTKIKQNLKSPLYHLWFHGMGDGILGGKLISHYYQGRTAGKIVLDILNGKNISEISVKIDSPNKYFFDYPQLKQFDIKISKLPKESIIINKPISFYEENKVLVWSIGSFIIFLIMVIFIIIINIMKRRQVEKKLKSTNNSLEEKSKELETIIEEAPNPIILHSEDGNIIMMNKAWIDISGYKKDEIPTINSWIKSVYKDINTQNLIREHVSGLYEITEKLNEGTFAFNTKHNKEVEWQFSSSPLGLIDGKRTIITSAMDVTELKTKDEIIFEQSKLAAMGEMIGNIAHQWRQPLSVISTGASGLLVSKQFSTLTDEDLEKTCNIITDNVQYLSRTIDDFKNYIKGEREKVNFSLDDEINSFLEFLEGTIKNNEIHVIKNTEGVINMYGYSNELTQCLINIFNNAKDALKDIAEDKYIFISTSTQNNNAIISFKDNAGGIPNDILHKVFEPYFTTKHKSQGTGLGLHMTYNLIVDGMKGSIEANNVTYEYEGQEYTGAEFIITLPMS